MNKPGGCAPRSGLKQAGRILYPFLFLALMLASDSALADDSMLCSVATDFKKLLGGGIAVASVVWALSFMFKDSKIHELVVTVAVIIAVLAAVAAAAAKNGYTVC